MGELGNAFNLKYKERKLRIVFKSIKNKEIFKKESTGRIVFKAEAIQLSTEK